MTATTVKKRDRKEEPTAPVITSRIHLADGNKGGVGKSFLCRTLYQWFVDHQVPVVGIEADVNSPDFKGIYPEVAVSQFSEDETLGARANSILNTAVEAQQAVVVNLPATVHGAFQSWVNNYGIVTLAAEHQVELVKWFVVTGEFDSLKSLEISLNAFGQQIPHVVVRNLKYAEWDFFDGAEDLQALIQETGSQVIDLPKLPLRVASTLLQQRLSFAAGQSHQGKGFGIVEQAAVKTYLRAAYAHFEKTGYLPR
ncbi:MAG: hypothetical protein F6K00_31595 [Leptolyngbya sp. SIOISBB]|nr:hypothetical protein [Leptolyngbya sp. SIOISBB]